MLSNENYEKYKEYVKNHAIKHEVTEDEAETHLIVKYYKKYLEDREDNTDNARAF